MNNTPQQNDDQKNAPPLQAGVPGLPVGARADVVSEGGFSKWGGPLSGGEEILFSWGITLPETNVAPENRPPQ